MSTDSAHPDRDSSSGRERKARLGRYWRTIETAAIGLPIGGALALVTYTVIIRFFAPAYAPALTNEVTVYVVVWAILLACGRVSGRREHVRADLVIHLMPDRVQRLANIAGNLTGVGFAAFLVWFGSHVAYDAWSFNYLSPTLLRFPLWIYYSSLPVAAVLIGIGHLQAAIDLARGAAGTPDHMQSAE